MATQTDFDNLIRIMRNPASTAEQKKVAAATIAVCLIDSQAQGGTVVGGALSDIFAAGADFDRSVANIQSAVSRL